MNLNLSVFSLVLFDLKEYSRVAIVGLGKKDENANTKRLAAGVGVQVLKDNGATGVISIDSSFGNLQGIINSVV